MTAQCRPLLLSTATALFLLPACLQVDATPFTQPDPAARVAGTTGKTQFAELPSRPGMVVATKPAAKDATTTLRPADPPTTTDGGVKVAGAPGQPLVGPTLPNALSESPLLAAVRAFAEGRPDRGIEYLSALDKPNQELVLAILPALARGATADLVSDPAGTAILADQIRTAAGRIEPLAALRVDVVSLCRTVTAFGRYDPWPEGQPYHPNDQAYLYVEVRNLISQPTIGPRGEKFLTQARATVEIRDAHGGRIAIPDPEDGRLRKPIIQFEKKVFSHAPLHDFHILHPFLVPSTPGVYTVTIELRDQPGRRIVKAPPVEFRVAGP